MSHTVRYSIVKVSLDFIGLFSDTKMKFLEIYHDNLDQNVTAETRHGEHHHDGHDYYAMAHIVDDVMAHDPYVLLEQMIFRWVSHGP